MRQLIIKELKNKFGKITRIEIVKQTHTGNQFTENGNTFVHNRFFLTSSCIIQSIDGGLYVLGTYSGENGPRKTNIPSKDWLRKMRAAVKAYNEYYFNCKNCEDRKCNRCPVDKKEL